MSRWWFLWSDNQRVCKTEVVITLFYFLKTVASCCLGQLHKPLTWESLKISWFCSSSALYTTSLCFTLLLPQTTDMWHLFVSYIFYQHFYNKFHFTFILHVWVWFLECTDLLLVWKVVHSKSIIVTAKKRQSSDLMSSDLHSWMTATVKVRHLVVSPAQLDFQFDSSQSYSTSSQEESISYAGSSKWTFLESNMFAVFPPNFKK